jgi:glutamate--cysteine ligase
VRFVLAQSNAHRETILGMPFRDDTRLAFERQAEESLARQREMEAADTLPFEAWRQKYLSPLRLR